MSWKNWPSWLKGGLILLVFIFIPMVVAQSAVGEPPPRYINSLYSWIAILLVALLLTLPIFYFFRKLSLKDWLKGGIIAVIALIIFLFLFGVITAVLNNGKCGFWDAPGETLGYCFIFSTTYVVILIVPVFVLGALISFVIGKINSKKEIPSSSRDCKKGFWMGLIFAIIFLFFQIYHIIKEITNSTNPFPEGINLKIILNIVIGPLFGFIAIIIFFVLVGWIVSKIRGNRR